MRTKPKWLFPVLALLPVLGLYGLPARLPDR